MDGQGVMGNWGSRFLKAILLIRRWCVDHRKTAIAGRAAVLGLPPAVWGYAIAKPGAVLPFQAALLAEIAHYPWIAIAVFSWPILGSLVFDFVADLTSNLAKANDSSFIEVMAFVTAIDDIVGRKLRRFGGVAKRIQSGASGADVFAEITQPILQIESLVQNLCTMLTSITDDRSLKVVLATIENDLPKEWMCYHPNDATPSIDLRDSAACAKSFFAHCAKSKQAVVLPDIKKHLGDQDRKRKPGEKRRQLRYLASGDPEKDAGSIAAYPVHNRHLGTIPFVLSIKSDSGTITNAFVRKHKFILEAFIKRLEMEHNLLYIKRAVANEHNKAT